MTNTAAGAGVWAGAVPRQEVSPLTISRIRARALIASAVAALAAALLLAPAGAQAATLKACVNKKSGAVRLISGKKKCRKSEKKISWNTKGVAGTNGTNGTNGANGINGTNGTNGAPGEPQKMVKFSASQAAAGSPTAIALFTADGISYTFDCQFVVFLNVAEIKAAGPSGAFYGAGIYRRSNAGLEQTNDPIRDISLGNIVAGGIQIANTPTASLQSGSVEQMGIWTLTIEGPTSTTWIHARLRGDSTCSVQGTAITVAN
jgi:hypothetical protein